VRSLPGKRSRLFFEKLSPGALSVLGVGSLVLLGLLDHLLGAGGALLIFSAVPVMVGAMYGGLRPGLLLALAAGGAWLLTDWLADLSATRGHLLLDFAARTAALLLLAALESARERALRKEWGRSHTDPLTGADNSRAFREKAWAEIARMGRHGKPMTVAYLDLDNFKASNDRYGHSAGDGLLVAVAAVLRATTRSTDTVARIGGDEFAVLLPESGRPEAEATLIRVRDELDHIVEKGKWPTGFSIGAVTFATPPPSVDALLHEADQVMYAAKTAGKGRTLFAP